MTSHAGNYYKDQEGKTHFNLYLKPYNDNTYAENVKNMLGGSLPTNSSLGWLRYTIPNLYSVVKSEDFNKKYKISCSLDCFRTSGSTWVRQLNGDVKTVMQVCVSLDGIKPDIVVTDSMPVALTNDGNRQVSASFLMFQEQYNFSSTNGAGLGTFRIKHKNCIENTVFLRPFTTVDVALVDATNVYASWASAIPQQRYIMILHFEEE